MEPRKFKIGIRVPLEEWEETIEEEKYGFLGLFSFLVRGMNFSCDYVIDTGENEELPNGTITGLTGLLNRSEVHFVPLPFFVTAESWEDMAYNYPYACDEFTFATRMPTYNPEIMAIFRTISASAWLSLLISIILVTLIFFTVLKYRYTLDDVILHVLAIALNQGGNIIPKKAGEVLLIGTWLMAMMLFTTCFKSVLLSFLSFPPLTGVKTVSELADAIRAGKYVAMTRNEISLAFYLKTSPNEDIRFIGEHLFKKPSADVEDLFNKSYSNVAIADIRSFMTFAGKELFISEDSLGSYMTATLVSKDFCCKEEMDMIIHRFLAAGINLKIDRFTEYKDAFYSLSDIPDDDTRRKITLTDISGAFIFLVAGYCLSTVVLIIELKIKSREMLLASAVYKKSNLQGKKLTSN